MPWHLSKSDPRKVYDERHEVACVCRTAEQAARIVAAMTGKATLVLREPAPPMEREGKETFIPSDGKSHIAPLDTFEPDSGCCGREIAKASRNGALRDGDCWDCPTCGCTWKADPRIDWMVRGRHWSPAPAISIFRNLR